MAKAGLFFATLIYGKNLMGCQVEMATSSVAPLILNQGRKNRQTTGSHPWAFRAECSASPQWLPAVKGFKI